MNQALIPIFTCSAAGVIVGLLLGSGTSYQPAQNEPKCVDAAAQPALVSAPSLPQISEAETAPQVAAGGPTTASPATPTPAATETPALSPLQAYSVASRVSSIGNFVNLSEEQKERLRIKFEEELRARKAQRPAQSESLDDIIGAESAGVYRERLKSAFERSAAQALDKEVFYLSRKLGLSAQQELDFRAVYQRVEDEVAQAFEAVRAGAQYQSNPAARVRSMIAEQELRTKRLSEELRAVLSPDQLEAYMQEESDSAASEVGIWHER